MKHAHVDETLTRAEREAPFRLADAEADPVEGPTRLACVVTETDDSIEIKEFDVLPCLRVVGRHWRAMNQIVANPLVLNAAK